MADAVSSLPDRLQRLIILKDGHGQGYAEVARGAGVDAKAVPLLLARARLTLRDARRGSGVAGETCTERDRALRLLAQRQDREATDVDDETWLRRHLAACEACSRAHAAMLETSVWLRAWQPS